MKSKNERSVSQMEIARQLGVSIATVSRVLSGKADTVRCVAPGTIARVRDAAARLGYRMNFAGRMLRTRRANAVGLLFSSMSPSYLELVTELQRQLFSRGYAALCGFWAAEEDAGPTISAVVERDVDGIITCHWPDVMRRLAPDVPTVFYLGHDPSLDCVNSTGRLDLLLDHLAGLGHRNIALFGNWREGGVRHPGLNLVCLRFARDAPPEAHNGLDEIADALATGRSRKDRPTAVICAGDYTAATLASLLMRRGLRVPEDIAVAGTGTSRAYESAVPPVTTFGVATADLAKALVDALFFRMENRDAPPQQIFLPPTLTVRESTEARAMKPQSP